MRRIWLTPAKLGLIIVVLGLAPAVMIGSSFQSDQKAVHTPPTRSTTTGLGSTGHNVPAVTTGPFATPSQQRVKGVKKPQRVVGTPSASAQQVDDVVLELVTADPSISNLPSDTATTSTSPEPDGSQSPAGHTEENPDAVGPSEEP